METGTVIALAGMALTVLLTLFGIVFQGGRLTARVEHLEAYRGERRQDQQDVLARLDRLETMVAHVEARLPNA